MSSGTLTARSRPWTDRARTGEWLQRNGVYVAVVVLLVFNLLFTANFLSTANFRTQLLQAAPVCIVALGMALVIGTQGVDLSVGAVMSLSAALIPLYLGYGVLISILVALLAGLVAREVMETLVGVFGEAHAGEQARGFLGRGGGSRKSEGGRRKGGVIGSDGRGFAVAVVRAVCGGGRGGIGREIHFLVGRVEKRELAGKTFLEEITRDGAGFVEVGQRVAREDEAGGRRGRADPRAGSLPAFVHLRGELGFGARAADLIGHEAAIRVDGVGDLAEGSLGVHEDGRGRNLAAKRHKNTKKGRRRGGSWKAGL